MMLTPNQQEMQKQPGIFDEVKGIFRFSMWVLVNLPLPLHIFSRVPGTVGSQAIWPGIFVGWFAMLLFPVFLFEMNEYAVLPFWVGQYSFWGWGIHFLCYYIRHCQGRGVHPGFVGLSWLNLVTGSRTQRVACIGDSLVALGLAAYSSHVGETAFAKWWLLMIPATFVSDFIIAERDRTLNRGITGAGHVHDHQKKMFEHSFGNEDME